MAKDGKSKEGGSTTIIALAGLLGLGALALVFHFRGQAGKAEELLLRSKDEYRQMQDRKKAVEEYRRKNIKDRPQPGKDEGDMLTFLDRKARESQIPAGGFTIAKNATATVGNWLESSYTITLQSEKKDSPVLRNPVVDFIGKVERERRSTKTKSLQLTFAGNDFKTAIISFSHFQPKP